MKTNEIASLFGIEEKEGMFVGKINDFDVQLELFKMGYLKMKVLNVILNRPITNSEFVKLRKQTKLRGRILGIPNSDFITININELSRKNISEKKKHLVIDNVYQVLSVLQSLGFTSPTSCMICQEDRDEELIPFLRTVKNRDSVLGLAHRECINKLYENEINQIQTNNQNTERIPFSGFLAIMGSFIVTLITFLVAVYGGLWLGILFVLIPVAGYYGYKLGKAPLSKGASIFVLVESSVIIAIMLIFLVFLVALGNNITILETIQLLIRDIIIALVFYAVGVGLNIKYLFGNTNEKKLARLRANKRK